MVLVLVAGFVFMCCRKRRNRRLRLGDEHHRTRGRIASKDYPISPLSFRCQAQPAPYESAIFKNSAEVVVVDESSRTMTASSPIIGFTHTASPKALEAEAFEKPNYGGWQPQIPKSRVLLASRPAAANRPLHPTLDSITTTTAPAAVPAVPGSVHHAWSPHITRFSPIEDNSAMSPQSATSTTALLPLKPYNPAEWGGATPTMPTPTSGATASPLIGRTWDDMIPRKSSLPPSQQQQQQQQQTPRPQQKREPWGELPPRPSAATGGASPARETTSATLSKASLAVITATRAPQKHRGRGGRGGSSNGASPVETSTINIVFAGPPKR